MDGRPEYIMSLTVTVDTTVMRGAILDKNTWHFLFLYCITAQVLTTATDSNNNSLSMSSSILSVALINIHMLL